MSHTKAQGHKATHLTLRQRILDLVDLDLTEALDLEQIAAGRCVYRGNGEVPVGFELRNVVYPDAMGLDGVNIDDVAVL